MSSLASIERERDIETIHKLFKSGVCIRIPAYQRAYSWETKQCLQFLEDLMEQKGKTYYLGQFLFEKENNSLFIIDGQQRLTTTILFLSAIVKILSQKNIDTSNIRSIYLNDVFRTIEDDHAIFKKITQKQFISVHDHTDTISQKRMTEAFCLFEEKLQKHDITTLNELSNTLESAIITTYNINSKVEATQVFEYQNNRGKDLSRFEVVKAYLMHKIYLCNTDDKQANSDIADIERNISSIYRYIETAEGYFTENELLDSYCSLYYNIDGSIESIKDKLNKAANKTEWIKSFFENFVDIALSAKSIVNSKEKIPEITNLFFVGYEANWKIVLLVLFYRSEISGVIFHRILKLLEILCFKLKLGDYRSDHLDRYAKNYFNDGNNYDLKHLYKDIKHATIHGFKEYWDNDNRFSNIIINYFDQHKMHYNRNIIRVVLWQYENHLRVNNRAGALMDKNQYAEYTIEHIRPQNPTNEEYTEEFKKNYLHLAGNLALLTKSQNSSYGNKSYEKKKELFQDTALSSYTEIRAKAEWAEAEITERHNNISTFAKAYFDTSVL